MMTIGVDKLFLLVAGLSALIGIVLGGFILEGAYEFRVTHVHLLLFGWLSNAVYGLFYRGCPELSKSKLAWAHFGAAVIGTLGLSIGFLFQGEEDMMWLLWTGANLATLSAVLFLVSVVQNIRLEIADTAKKPKG